MSNDVIKSIQSELALIPQGGVDDDTRAVAGTAQNKRISIKGGVFRKMAGGKEVGVIEDRHMEIIFVKMAHEYHRQYFTEAFKEGEAIAPVCWSSDCKTPDLDVENPQSPICSTCPQAVKGSAQQGPGAACRFSRRTAVVLPRDPAGDVMQLTLPATSIFGDEDNGKWPHTAYVRMLAANGISASRVITRMQFDTKSATPKLLFSPVGPVPQDMIDIIKRQGASAEAEEAIKLKVFKKKPEDEAAAPAQPVLRQVTADAKAEPEKDVPEIIKKWSKK